MANTLDRRPLLNSTPNESNESPRSLQRPERTSTSWFSCCCLRTKTVVESGFEYIRMFGGILIQYFVSLFVPSFLEFPSHFDEIVAPATIPKFHKCGWSEVLKQSAEVSKPIFVYIHKKDDSLCSEYCKSVLTDSLVASILEANFICWGDYLHNVAKHRSLLRTFPESLTSFCGILNCSIENGVLRCRKVASQGVSLSLDETVQFLTEGLEKYEALVQEIFQSQNRHLLDRQIRQQQEEEYKNALLADTIRENESRRKAEKKLEEEAKTKMTQDKRKRLAEEFRLQDATASPLASTKDTTTIQVRFRDGKRAHRTFKEDDKYELLHNWVSALQYLLDQAPEVPRDFSLAVPIPHKTFGSACFAQTLKDLNLVPSVTLVVVDEETEDETSSSG